MEYLSLYKNQQNSNMFMLHVYYSAMFCKALQNQKDKKRQPVLNKVLIITLFQANYHLKM
jgi:hypothetical protein